MNLLEYEVVLYNEHYQKEWDDFCDDANTTFICKRSYMDYHSNRFDDYSLVIKRKDNIAALLPCHRVKDKIYSHLGLTYAGLIYKEDSYFSEVKLFWELVLKFLNENKFESITVKSIPDFYTYSAREDFDYIANVLEAQLIRTDLSIAVNKNLRIPLKKGRKSSVSKARKFNLTIKESFDFESFWLELLMPELNRKYNTVPVHSLHEINYLANNNKNDIKQFDVYFENLLVGGCTIYIFKSIIHVQYISSSAKGREIGALDFLFDYLINVRFKNYNYFDFGTVNENEGKNINKGLLEWKEGFGARSYCHKTYSIRCESYNKLIELFV
jgi:hypothetical protein